MSRHRNKARSVSSRARAAPYEAGWVGLALTATTVFPRGRSETSWGSILAVVGVHGLEENADEPGLPVVR